MVIGRVKLFLVFYLVGLTLLAVVGYAFLQQRLTGQNPLARHEVRQTTDVTFHSLPRLNFMLSNPNGGVVRVRVDISLEVKKTDDFRLDAYDPVLTNNISGWFQRQDVSELMRSNAMEWARKDLLREVNGSSLPVPVVDVVFRNFLVM